MKSVWQQLCRGRTRNAAVRLIIFACACIVVTGSVMSAGCRDSVFISGRVFDECGPVSHAVVRVQGTDNETASDDSGRFVLRADIAGKPVTVSAWKHGYYCAKVENVVPPAAGVTVALRRYQTGDNPDYEWMPPVGEESCATCKPSVTALWLGNAHAGAARNERFLTMYAGTDVHGNQSPPTRYIVDKEYGRRPLPPDPSLPYYGPGYKLDFPDHAGNCAACHMPGAAANDPYGTDPLSVRGADTYGVHCDYCHKVADVLLDNATGLPFENMPGVLSSDIRRPFADDPDRYQLFFGTFDDDNVPEEDTYLPLIEESAFCAPCHFGVFWDTLVYNSYGEWLESPYSDPATGATCQDCHMPAPSVDNGTVITNVAPGHGGIERDPLRIHAHLQLGSTDEAFLQDALTMEAAAQAGEGTITVSVSLTNDNTGHHIPTDSPLRHMILLVEAADDTGAALELLDGDVLPEWCGEDSAENGHYGGLPGKAYARVLEELWTGIYPTGAYWGHTLVRSDTRLAAFQTDTSVYTFARPLYGSASVSVRLIYRRAFIELMDQKGWSAPDITMAYKQFLIE